LGKNDSWGNWENSKFGKKGNLEELKFGIIVA